MKKSDLNKMLGLIDDKYLNEANPTKKKSFFTSGIFLKMGAFVACFLLLLNVVLLPLAISFGSRIGEMENELDSKNELIDNILDKLERPHTQNYYELNLGQLGGTPSKITISSPQTAFPSSYDGIIDSLKKYYFDGGVENDKFEENEDSMQDAVDQDAVEQYEETTDLQEGGVVEGDIVKRTNKHIYHLNGSKLAIYSIDGKDSMCVGAVSMERIFSLFSKMTVNDGEELNKKEEDYSVEEMFLSSDGREATIVVNAGLSYNYDVPCVCLIALNVEDPQDVYVSNITTLYGRYKSARMVNGELLVFTSHSAPNSFFAVPQYSDGDGFVLFDEEKIHTENANNASYLLAYRINESTLKVNDAEAFISYTGHFYVSDSNIYLTKSYLEKTSTEKKTVTDILRVSYQGNEFSVCGKITVDGYIKDRYSLSEYNGFLRVATTTTGSRRYYEGGDYISYGTSASLYVVELSSMTLAGSVLDFAPVGETVRSVKFKGNSAFVCTAKQVSDPVFFFDLTDVNNITYKDTGTIPGFSTSLIEFGDDLLGVGVDSNRNFKLEAYRESGNSVESVCYHIVNGNYSTDYKAYYINREMGLFGLGVYDENNFSPNRYILFRYDGEKFTEVVNIAVNGTRSLMRGILIGDYFYIITDKEFKVVHTPPSAFGML